MPRQVMRRAWLCGVAGCLAATGLLPASADGRGGVLDKPDQRAERPGQDCFRDAQTTFAYAQDGACIVADGPESLRRGDPADFRITLCAGRHADSFGLSFLNGQEHELRIRPRDAETAIWARSQAIDFAEVWHERDLPPGRCLVWRPTWPSVASDGRRVPAGDYVAELVVLDAAGRWGEMLTLPLTVAP